MLATKRKPYEISKYLVSIAYKMVKAKAGAEGVDEVTIEVFEKDLQNNLYKIWNRMSSGSYFPPPVRAVPIPKKNGGERILGVPTVADRVAQTVVKLLIEPTMEKVFLPDSYGYRPGKSTLDALEATRKRCRWTSIRTGLEGSHGTSRSYYRHIATPEVYGGTEAGGVGGSICSRCVRA